MTPRIINNPPAPGTPEWRGMITASKVAALLGVSRYKSPYAEAMEMMGELEPKPFPPELALRGHLKEPFMAEWWKAHNPGWLLNKGGEVAYTDPDLPFPNLVTLDRRAYNPRRPKDRCFHIVECKTARDLSDWGKPGTENSVPDDYQTQVIFQMGVSGIHEASVVVDSHTTEIHEVKWDKGVFDFIVERMAETYQALLRGEAPQLDDSVCTYEAVRGLHPDIEQGKEVQLSQELAIRLLDALAVEDEAKAAARAAKIELMEVMGDAQYAMVGDTKLASRYSSGNQEQPARLRINKKANLERD